MKIFSGRESMYFAKKVAFSLNMELSKSTREDFSDGEFIPSLDETVRGQKVFIIQSTFPPAENLLELQFMIDAARRAGAEKIYAVLPYFGFARQDKKDKPRVPIGAAVVAKSIQNSGANQIITMDLHAEQIQGFVDIPVTHISADTVFIPHISTNFDISNLVVASPDVGGSKRAKKYSQMLGTELVICYKHRAKANVVGEMILIGNVEGKDVVVIDDIIDTAGTVCKAADTMIEKGAKSVSVIGTHPVLSGKAIYNIGNSKINKVIITDSIPLKEIVQPQICNEEQNSFYEIITKGVSKIEIVSVANIFASVIKSVEDSTSVSDNFLK